MSKIKLQELICKIDTALETQGEFYTEGNKIAILDLVSQAKLVLAGKYKVPFIRNREFYTPNENDDINFSLKRYSMAPSFNTEGYGLEVALKWFLDSHVMNDLENKKEIAIEKAKNFGIILNLGNLSGVELGKKVVLAYNEIREKRLKQQNIKNENLFFNEDEIKLLKENLDKNSEFEKIKSIADIYSLDDIKKIKYCMCENIDYKKLNNSFYIWSKTDKVITFESPRNACYAELKLILESDNNAKTGLSYVWIDDIAVFPAKGMNWDIKNPGFEEGLAHWEQIILKGNPKLEIEHEYPYCGKDSYSVYLENKYPSDEGGIKYAHDIKINGGVYNTISFSAKLDGKLKKGIKIVITFKDEQKNIVGEFVDYFNRKSCLATVDFALSMQCDAIMYFLTGNKNYAKKAEKQIVFVLNDFCQGIEYWLKFNKRPHGSDAYGAVQGGRILCSVMGTYTFLKDTLSKEYIDSIIPLLEYFVRYLMDLRDREELNEYDIQNNTSNWQTDMAAGTGFLMMAIPNFPNAGQWLYNANALLRSQLKFKVNNDGSWPESIRYHFAALERFAIYAKVLSNCTGEDWFKDGPILKMFKYPMMMQTPKYNYFDNKISTPNFGDHHLSGGGEYITFGIYMSEVAKRDMKLASQMYETWEMAGKPTGHYWGEAVAAENLFSSNFIQSESCLELVSTAEFKDSGITVFRKNYNNENESYFAIMASPKKIGHGHYDEGSFIIYKNNVPVVIDPGIEGYFDSTKDWYVSSSAHSTVQFSRKGGKKLVADPFDINLEKTDCSALEGFNDTERTAQRTDFKFSDKIDSVTVRIENPEGGTHIRKVTYLREEDIYILDDKIEAFSGELRFNLAVLGNSDKISDNKILTKGCFDVDLETVFLSDVKSINIEKGRCVPMSPNDKGEADFIRVIFEKCLLTVLYPKEKKELPLIIDNYEDYYLLNNKYQLFKKSSEVEII